MVGRGRKIASFEEVDFKREIRGKCNWGFNL